MQISTASTAITTTSVSMMHHGQVKLDLGQVLNIQDKDLALSKGIAYLTSLRPSNPRRVKPSDPQESEESHFQKLGLIDIQRYLDVSTQVMEKLDALFQGSDNSYLPWVKYFDACNKAKIAGGYSDENLEVFIKGISQLTIRLLLKDGQKEMIDWRIGKQLLALQRLFEPSLTAMVKPEQLVEAFLREIEEGLKGLIWQDQNRTTLFTKQALQNLQEVIPPLKNDKKVLNAVISGRFDKADFAGLGHTLILGEDGGLFLLLNAVNEEEKKILEDAVSSDYLKDKVSGVKQTTRKEQIVIGKGGFGKVRFAVSLFGAKTRPGDIICIKKTGSFAKLNADMRARQEVGYPVAEQVIDATLGDYFTGDIAKAVYSPAIVDMALVMSKEFIKKPLHQKGYLMMEIMPQNTGIRIFKDPEYQKWEYQKPYLIDVMEGVIELLARKLAMTDLKPENTLYNKDTRKATIIDLGGAIEVADLAKFDTASSFQSTPGYQAPELLQKGTIDITKALAYSCGKILEKITNSEGFTTDYNKEEIEQLIKKLTNQVPIKRLSIDEALRKIRDMGDDSSTQQAIFSHYIIKIKERLATNKASLSINDDIEVTEKLYLNSEVTRLDSYKHRGLKREDLMKRLSLFFHRKDQAVEEEEEEEKRLEEPTEPETTDKTFELQTITTLLGSIQYLSLEHLKQMTVGYLNFIDTLERHQLSSEFGDFMQELDNIIEKGKKTESQTKAKVKDKLEQYQRQVEKQDTQLKEVQRKTKLKEESGVGDKQVFLLLGAPGSGKSITVQLRFIQAVNNWKPGKALPVYFNLANGIDLAEILTSMNQLLGTKVTLKELYNQQVDLYVDSFDQGIGEKRLEERDGLIDNYIKQLSTQPGIKEQDPNGDEASARRRKIKVLVSCRSDYLQNNSDEAWFAPKVSAKKIGSDETIDQPQLNLVETGYIVPITYQTDKELATNIDKHLDYRKQGEAVKRKKAFDMEYNADWYTEKIKSADLKEFIDTGFMFDIVMETLPTLTSSKITRQDIYTAFVTIHADRALKKHPWTQEQLQQIEHSFPNYGTNSDEQSFFAQLGQYIASQLHISNQLMLNQNSIIFLLLNYRKDLPFRYQMAYYLLRVLPVKIEIKVQDSVGVPQDHSDISRKRQEEIKIGFTNDTLKNYYLVQAILQELEKTGTSQLLACRNIVKDKQLINSLFQAIEYGPKAETWRQILLQTVLRTKIDKCPEAITCAANAITVLNLLQYVLPGQDLSNISIKGANLRNCWLPYTNFSGAVLTNVNLTNAKLMDANLAKTNLSGVKLSIFPDLLGHKNDVYKVIYSPDGKKLATCDEDSRSKTIIIWDVATGTQLHSLSGGLLCFSPDGQTIASASDKTMTIWDVATAKQLHTLNGRSLSYSPKGQTLAVLPHGKDPVQIFTTNCKLLLALKSSDEATSLSYSPDGKTIATGSNNNAKIWDIATGKLLHTLTGKLMDTYTVCYSPDGQTLAAISSKRIRIWNVATNEELPQILTDLGSEGVKYSPDSRTIATFYYGTLRIWDVAAGKQLGTDIEAHSYEITSMSYSPDGRSIATASKDNTIRIWDTDSGKQLGSDLMGHSNEVYSISYSPDGKTIASGSRDNTVRIWSVSTEEQLEATRNGHSQAVTSAIYSPDGKTIATASEEKTMKFWDAATGGRKKADWDFEDKFMFCYAPNHKTIAIGSGKVSILDAVTGKMLGKQMELPTVIERVRSMSYSPNSKILVTGLEDGTILIWDPATQKQMGKLKGHSGWIYSLSFSPDGKTLATGSKDYTVKIWDVAKYKQLGVDLKGHSDQVRAVSFSPDGKTVASGSEDKTIKLWDIATYKQVGADFVGHSDYVLCLSFSPDSKTIVSGSRDTMIKLWNVATGKQQGSDLQGHLGDINSVSFSPNGKTITSASDDRSVKIWAERNGKWMVIRDVNAADTPLNVENMTIEDAILSKQNMTIFEQRKCNKQQNIILAKEQETIQEEQEETQQIQESTKKLETELFAKFKLENNVSNDLNSDNNQQLPRSNFIKLEISLLNNQEEQKQEQKQEKEEEKEKETQSEQANIEPDTSKRQSNPNHNITPEPYTTGPPQNQAIRNNSSTCCGVFCIQGLQYHNPILNNPQLLNKLIAVCGSVSSALALAEAIYVNRREN